MSFSARRMKPRLACELCSGDAAVYCEADAASLCWNCDTRVHGANFLVARHVRRVACASCHSLDPDRVISGPGTPPVRSICRSCSPYGPGLSSSASSPVTSCVSTADSRAEPEEEEGASTSRVEDGGGRGTGGRVGEFYVAEEALAGVASS